jgi:hypothetical protein
MNSFDAVYESLPGDGWLTRPEAELLWRAANLADGPILEIGSYKGRSTCLLGATGRPVYAVDPFDGFHSELSGDEIAAALLANLEYRRLSNVVVFRQRVEDWHPLPVNFAYLDGAHDYDGTLWQVRVALECGAKVIAAHDVNDRGEGLQVRRACLELLGQWGERVERLAVWDRRAT